MHTINIRGVKDPLYDKIKAESQSRGLSINKFLVNTLSGIFNKKEELEYHDMDDLFGTWTDKEYKLIEEAVSESRLIDDELWK